jgi:hypothetical protein
MTAFERFVTSFRSQWISPSEVRLETWALGGRHQGRALEGARSELKAGGISIRQAVLLRAVIRSLRH